MVSVTVSPAADVAALDVTLPPANAPMLTVYVSGCSACGTAVTVA